MEKPCLSFADGESDAGCGVGCNLVVWKRAIPRNRMRESLTSGSVGGLVEQSPILPGHIGSTKHAKKDTEISKVTEGH